MYSCVPNGRGVGAVGGAEKNPQSLSSRGVGISGGGWKMTKNVAEKVMVSYHKYVSK